MANPVGMNGLVKILTGYHQVEFFGIFLMKDVIQS